MAQITLNSTGVASNGALVLQSNGTTTAVTINASQGVEFNAGTAALPSITTTGDTNTGIFFPAADTIAFSEGGTEAMRIDASGNVGIGNTAPTYRVDAFQTSRASGANYSTSAMDASTIARINGGENDLSKATTLTFTQFNASASISCGYTATNAGFLAFGTTNGSSGSVIERARIDSSGNLLVGKTSAAGARIDVVSASGGAALQVRNDTATITTVGVWNDATSGDNIFVTFYTEAGATTRGSITYNRAGGLVAYNTTSDYRAKDISGPVTGSGALIDSVPVYMGTMKGATQERPMFIAHETPAYAHTGVKDAVDKDGNPVYQQMDASALIPVMWAEIQSLRKRLAALESK